MQNKNAENHKNEATCLKGYRSLEVKYKEPAGCFTVEMLKMAEEWDRKHGIRGG